MSLRDAFFRYLDDPHGPMPQELAEALERVDSTDWVERLIQHAGGEAITYRVAKSKRRGPNVEGVRRTVGQRVRLLLPDNGVVEVTVDAVRGAEATLVLATTSPYVLRLTEGEE